MVVKDVYDSKKKLKKMESRSLKFGMDRILSEGTTTSRISGSRAFCDSAPPCSACITSLYRCCRSATVSAYADEDRSAPPLRLYSNVLKPDEAGVADNLRRTNSTGNVSKRKKSWSRAVFSNLQRKGLEKRFQLQKYITKPDRRQLAATLGLTDAQVKVWFQNRRMKWRHARESAPRAEPKTDADPGLSPPASAVPRSRKSDSASASASASDGDGDGDGDGDSDVEVDVQTVDD